MIFRDYEDENNELLCGVRINSSEKGCKIEWKNYPFKCSKVYLFEVPLNMEFDEKMISEFKNIVIKYPEKSYNTDKICNFAVFTVDNNNTLIRQKQKMFYFPITIKYNYDEREEKILKYKSFFGIKKYDVIKHTFLEIICNTDISGKDVLYKLNEAESSFFSLPFNLQANKAVILEVKKQFEFYTDKPYINLIKSKP